MSEQTIALRYAKPLFELSKERNVIEEINNDMVLFKNTCESNPEFMAVMRSPVIRGFQKIRVIRELFISKAHKLTILLFELLCKKDREELLYEISVEFNKLYYEYKNIQKVLLVSAKALPEHLKKELISILAKKTGKTIELTEKTNPNLIGGFIVHVGNSQIDCSVSSNLKKIQLGFLQKIYSNI